MPVRSGESSASDVDVRSQHTIERPPPELAKLLNAEAVRERCGMVHDWVAAGRSDHFTLAHDRLDTVAAYVTEVTRENYPNLKVPPHSRWRHFGVGGIDRWQALAARLGGDAVMRTRAAIDLATVSVLLDAGAGNAWHYRERQSGQRFARSEGLAVASFRMFDAGAFSSDGAAPWQVDAQGLAAIDAATLAKHFHVDAGNALVGLEQRSLLLRRLGEALAARPDLFGVPARPGHLLDHFLARTERGRMPAAAILATLLEGLAPIWPAGLSLRGFPVGDAGRHPAVSGDPEQVVPFHKLSQWLAYSLIEPLETSGIAVVGLDALTALAEYRNGGLLIDLGAIKPRRRPNPDEPHAVGSELVVEWRALTVALMDRLLPRVRALLGLGTEFALPHLLQGGTWSAGRKIALALRPPDGPPPLPIAADGTVF
jgi:hypothetical protein